MGGCARDPSSATNVTLRHHECDLRRDPTRRGAGVRAPSLTRMGSRACYRGWRFKQGPLDLSWGNGGNAETDREPEDATLSITTWRTLRGVVVCVGRADSKSLPSLPLEQTAPWTFYQGTSSCHRLSLHRPHPITCSIPMRAFSCTVCQPHPPIGSCPRPWSHFAATSHFSARLARLARCSSPMLTGSPGQTERHSLSGLV